MFTVILIHFKFLDTCNVLIATGNDIFLHLKGTKTFYDEISCLDIVQEGLDIPTCSYVIRYEFVSDEIGTIQSRGRARAQDSSYYLITEINSTNHKRETDNKRRETDMEIVIEKWPTMDKQTFRNNVDAKTVKNRWNRIGKESIVLIL